MPRPPSHSTAITASDPRTTPSGGRRDGGSIIVLSGIGPVIRLRGASDGVSFNGRTTDVVRKIVVQVHEPRLNEASLHAYPAPRLSPLAILPPYSPVSHYRACMAWGFCYTTASVCRRRMGNDRSPPKGSGSVKHANRDGRTGSPFPRLVPARTPRSGPTVRPDITHRFCW